MRTHGPQPSSQVPETTWVHSEAGPTPASPFSCSAGEVAATVASVFPSRLFGYSVPHHPLPNLLCDCWGSFNFTEGGEKAPWGTLMHQPAPPACSQVVLAPQARWGEWLRGRRLGLPQPLPEAHSWGSVSGQTIGQQLAASGSSGSAQSLPNASHRPVVLAPGGLDTCGEEVAPPPGIPSGIHLHNSHAPPSDSQRLRGDPESPTDKGPQILFLDLAPGVGNPNVLRDVHKCSFVSAVSLCKPINAHDHPTVGASP